MGSGFILSADLKDGIDDVVPDKLKIGLRQEVPDIPFMTGVKIIKADYLMSLPHQLAAQVRAQEAGTAGNQDPSRFLEMGPSSGLQVLVISHFETSV